MTVLDYSRPTLPRVRMVLAAIAAVVACGGAAITVGCAAHAIRYEAVRVAANQSFCGTCAAEEMATAGPPIERTAPIGLMAVGVAVVAAFQSVRFANGARRHHLSST